MSAFAASLDAYLREHGIRHFTAREIAPVGQAASSAEHAPRLMPPAAELWGWIVPTLHIAEWLRTELGRRPIVVTSGWRDERYNRAVGGASASLHTCFNALDLRVAHVPPAEVLDRLAAHPLARWLGLGSYPSWTHIDTRGLFGHACPARWHE